MYLQQCGGFVTPKAISTVITFSECVSLALIIQHSKRRRRILWSSVSWLTLQYFPHYLTKCTIFERKVIESKTRVLIFSVIFVSNISQPKKKGARYYCKCTQ